MDVQSTSEMLSHKASPPPPPPRVCITVNYLLKNYLELVFKSDKSIALMAIPKFIFHCSLAPRGRWRLRHRLHLHCHLRLTQPTVMEVVGQEYHRQELRGLRIRRKDRHAIKAKVELMEKKASSEKYWSRFKKWLFFLCHSWPRDSRCPSGLRCIGVFLWYIYDMWLYISV